MTEVSPCRDKDSGQAHKIQIQLPCEGVGKKLHLLSKQQLDFGFKQISITIEKVLQTMFFFEKKKHFDFDSFQCYFYPFSDKGSLSHLLLRAEIYVSFCVCVLHALRRPLWGTYRPWGGQGRQSHLMFGGGTPWDVQ